MSRTKSSLRAVVKERHAAAWHPVGRRNPVDLVGLEYQQVERPSVHYELKPSSSVTMQALQQFTDFCRIPIYQPVSRLLALNGLEDQCRANVVETTGDYLDFAKARSTW